MNNIEGTHNKVYRLRKGLPLLLLPMSFDVTAYIGPGLGASAIGVIIGIIVSIILALFAILWYPIKRLFKQKRSTPNKTEGKE